jgi:phosphonate transport system substrate-binding protein
LRNRCSRNAPCGVSGARRFFWKSGGALALLATLLLGVALPGRAADPPLVFGVFPNLTARQTLATYHPLAATLERHLKRPVIVYSARDFPTFIARTHAGQYDLVLTAPHLAWLARQETGYRPLLKYSNPVRGLLVTRADSGLAGVPDLRGRTVAIADKLALATLAIEVDLGAQGIERGRDYKVVIGSTHANALALVAGGRADAAIVGLHPFRMLPDAARTQLRILAETPPLSSLTYLAHPRVRDTEADALRQGLLAFASSPSGRAFLEHGGYGELVAAEDSELGAFRAHALRAQALLREAR